MKKLFRLIIFLLVISAFGICAVARLFPLEYKEIIVYYSEEYDVSPTLVAAIIKAEIYHYLRYLLPAFSIFQH